MFVPEPISGKLRGRVAAVAAALVLLSSGPGLSQTAKTAPESRAQVELSYAPVVAKVAPAVVNIYTRRVVATAGVSSLFDDPFFRRFFGRDFNFGQSRERVQNSLGSGVIVSADGRIVTNNHVIQGADQITVVLTDRREYEAELLFADERTDLAVLRIDTGGEVLSFLEFSDSDGVEVGDIVLAIGNPFGVGQTVTSGIVSALSRTGIGISDYQFFIQTDAAINPGNSGGALVGLDGRLIGVNTAIFSRSGGSHGIGFAIPANMVRSVVQGSVVDGKLVRPWIGVGGQAITTEIAESLGLDRPSGVLVNAIYPDGPADRAGLKVGDIVLRVDDQEIFDPPGLQFRMALNPIGGTASFSVLRGDRDQKVLIRLDAAPEIPPRDKTQLRSRSPMRGATVANLSPALAEELKIDTFLEGVIVLGIGRGSSAHRLGLVPGDVFVAIDDNQIGTVDSLEDVIASHRGEWTIKIRRNGKILSATIRQ
ncbi:MAG: Do family serine endopeptidase [Sphingomonadales bacterium]